MIPTGSINVSSRRVLLIENSPGDRKLLRSWLQSEGIDTFEAVDIMTGLSACQKYIPNLILLQLRLNTWDGFQVIKRLKDDPRTRSIPVIFLANSALTAEKAQGIDMGAVDFVSQPYDSVELLARVHSALRTKALLDLLEQRAHLDGLTELGNRFALQQMIPQEVSECQLAKVPLSIVIADLDHFKKVNDRFGHSAGDEVLRHFAMILRHATRETDFLARYGGEEFVVLCPNCSLAVALEIAERIRAAVSDHPVTFRNSSIAMTTSVGVLSTSDLGGEDPLVFLDRADQALYRAKSAGRNVVWAWDNALQSAIPASEALSGGSVSQAAGAASSAVRKETKAPEAVAVRSNETMTQTAKVAAPAASPIVVKPAEPVVAEEDKNSPEATLQRLGIAKQPSALVPPPKLPPVKRPATDDLRPPETPREVAALAPNPRLSPLVPPPPVLPERPKVLVPSPDGQAAGAESLVQAGRDENPLQPGGSRPVGPPPVPRSAPKPEVKVANAPRRASNVPPPPPPNPRHSGEHSTMPGPTVK